MTSEHFEGEDLETRMQQVEDALALLRGDSRLANLPYGTLKQAASTLSVRSVGGSGGAYPAGVVNIGTPLTAKVYSANYLYAVPFYLPGVPNVVTKIGIKVTTLGAGNARLGIYDDKGEAKLYPGNLLLDAGGIGTGSTGVKGITVRHGLPRGLKWAVVVLSGTPVLAAIAGTAGIWCPLGRDEGGTNMYTTLRVAFSYAALPDLFPTGGRERPEEMPYIFLKFG